ncbi:MAG TPA: serine hydrolase domain-containing protein, partial [Steroidobacteraceae bacterium]|nr:serine hydrolase domain-containing protein [Steroidobacteraceae bacterium]
TSFSVGKSVTSILLGAAIQDGYIKSLDEPVTKYVPQLKGSGYDGVKIRQLITMTSGVKWNEDYTDMNSDVARSSMWEGEPGMNPLVSYMRRLPRESEPGTKFVYKTGETDMAGIVVANAVHKGLAQYMSEKLWQPYGMERDAIWMVDRGSMERGGCCISMTLRDYARVGLFVLEGGKANGKQVVPVWYLQEATTNQLKPPAQGDYGYFWWGRGDDGYSAQGIYGQQIRIAPKDNLIVVINAAFLKPTDRSLSAAQNAVLNAARETLK